MPQEMDRSALPYFFWVVWTALAGAGGWGCFVVCRLQNKILLEGRTSIVAGLLSWRAGARHAKNKLVCVCPAVSSGNTINSAMLGRRSHLSAWFLGGRGGAELGHAARGVQHVFNVVALKTLLTVETEGFRARITFLFCVVSKPSRPKPLVHAKDPNCH